MLQMLMLMLVQKMLQMLMQMLMLILVQKVRQIARRIAMMPAFLTELVTEMEQMQARSSAVTPFLCKSMVIHPLPNVYHSRRTLALLSTENLLKIEKAFTSANRCGWSGGRLEVAMVWRTRSS